MKTLILLLIPFLSLAQLPESGPLSIKSAAGAGRSISQQVDGNETGNKSLTTLSTTAGFSAPHSMLEFRGWPSVPAPDPVTNVSINIAAITTCHYGILIQWDYAVSGGTAEYVDIERSVNGGAYAFITSVAYPAKTFSQGVTQGDDILPNTQYQYRLTPRNNIGSGTPVTTSTVMTGAAPTAATGLTITNNYPSGISASWTPGSNNKVYWVRIYRNGVLQTPDGACFTSSSGTLPTAYYSAGDMVKYDVRSFSESGEAVSSMSAEIQYTDIPTAPSFVLAVLSGSNIDVSWGGSSGTITTYRIERSTNGGAYTFRANDSESPYSDAVSTGNEYKYRVRAEGPGGNSSYTESNTVNTTEAPGPPRVVTATASSGKITVSWLAPSSGGTPTSYTVERSVNFGEFSHRATIVGGGTTYEDTNILPGNYYTYRVRANNSGGSSTWVQTSDVCYQGPCI